MCIVLICYLCSSVEYIWARMIPVLVYKYQQKDKIGADSYEFGRNSHEIRTNSYEFRANFTFSWICESSVNLCVNLGA